MYSAGPVDGRGPPAQELAWVERGFWATLLPARGFSHVVSDR